MPAEKYDFTKPQIDDVQMALYRHGVKADHKRVEWMMKLLSLASNPVLSQLSLTKLVDMVESMPEKLNHLLSLPKETLQAWVDYQNRHLLESESLEDLIEEMELGEEESSESTQI